MDIKLNACELTRSIKICLDISQVEYKLKGIMRMIFAQFDTR